MTWLSNLFNFLGLNLLRLFAFLPYAITVKVGYGLGWLAAHIPNGRTHVVKTNLRLCFPNLSEKEIDALALEHWKLFGRSVLERSRIWLGSGKSIERQSRLRDLIREIQTGNFIFIAPDIDLGPRDSVFVPFFGIQTNTITSVSRLARLSGAEVCLMTTTLNKDRNGYTCHISEPLPNFPSNDVEKDTARLNHYIEELVRKRPAEYYWVHKRFKHRPPGEPSLYD
jgi:lauroyl/myristoyl acyltransferase